MAVPSIRMPSFGLTAAEKADNNASINATLQRCEAVLADEQKKHSPIELRDIVIAVQDAIVLAHDADACESPPLARCYLYKGHILETMKKYIEAGDAYRKAAKQPTGNHPADAEQAAERAAEMDRKVRDGKRRGRVGPSAYESGLLRISKMQSVYEWRIGGQKKSFHYPCPPVQHVGARRTPCLVERPQLRRSHQPQRLVPCDGGWTAEAACTPRIQSRFRPSIRCVTPEPSPCMVIPVDATIRVVG